MGKHTSSMAVASLNHCFRGSRDHSMPCILQGCLLGLTAGGTSVGFITLFRV